FWCLARSFSDRWVAKGWYTHPRIFDRFTVPEHNPLAVIGSGVGQGGVDAYSPRCAGIANVNVEPAPTWLVTQILPPCNSMNFRHKVSPRPVPSAFLSARPHLAKLLEYGVLVPRRNAHARIANRDLHESI